MCEWKQSEICILIWKLQKPPIQALEGGRKKLKKVFCKVFFNIAQALETEKTKMLKYIIDKYYTKVERPPKIPAPRISTELETQLESQVLILQDRLNLIARTIA